MRDVLANPTYRATARQFADEMAALPGVDHAVGLLEGLVTGSGALDFGPMSDPELPDSIAANIAEWTETNAQYTDAQAESAWAPQDLTWGVFGVREDAIGSPLGDVSGSTSSSSAAERPTSRPSSRSAARGRWGSTRRRPSSPPRGG